VGEEEGKRDSPIRLTDGGNEAERTDERKSKIVSGFVSVEDASKQPKGKV